MARLPTFTAAMTSGKTFDSAQLLGKAYLLYFYPKDNTPGCTQQGADFRDQYAEFTALELAVFGVSRDSIKSHENFKAKMSFPFELISDPDETLCQLFEVMKMKNMYGKQVRGIERSTFLINEQGEIAQSWRGVKVPGHVAAVLQAVSSR